MRYKTFIEIMAQEIEGDSECRTVAEYVRKHMNSELIVKCHTIVIDEINELNS